MFQTVSRFLNHSRFAIFALVVMAYTLGAQSDKYFKWTKTSDETRHNISSDGSGYYAYLPQTFIYGTKHFEFAEYIQRKYPGSKFFEGVSAYGAGKSDKYFVGTAICISPFFLAAHQVTKIAGGEADGYSKPYEISVLVAAIAFWLLGALSLLAMLQSYGIGRFPILFGIAGLTFATNLNFYIVYDPSFSHVYTYGIVCFLLLQLQRFADTQKSKHLLWIFFLLGMITIIRPTNLCVALIVPFFFGSFRAFWDQLKNLFQNRKLILLAGTLIFGALIFIQFLNIRSQHGHWGFNAYTAEGFDYLFSPKIGEVLFGFRKGFFVYTPFMLLIIPALYFLYRWNKYFFIGFLATTAVFVYIMASWWCWYYGGSLGMRPLIDIYGLLIIPMIIMFHMVNVVLRTFLLVLLAFMIKFNLVLNYQLMHAILHYADMDKSRFKTIFMQTGRRFEWIFHMTQPSFDESKYSDLSTFSFNPVSQQWETGTVKNQTQERFVPSLIYVPVQGLDSDIAVSTRYYIHLGSEENIPKALLFGYQKGERKELSVNFIGTQVPSADKPCLVEAQLYSSEKYATFDSLEVILENGDGKGIISGAKCSFEKRAE